MTLRLAGLALCLIAAAGSATSGPVDRSPRPVPRPATIAAAPIPLVAPVTSPRPHPRPGDVTPEAARPEADAIVPVLATVVLVSLRPRPRPETPPSPILVSAAVVRTQPVPEITLGRKGSVCGDPAIKGQSIAPIVAKLKGCGLEEGVNVTSIAGVKLSEAAVVDCATARALKDWVEGTLIPSVGTQGGGVDGLQVAASYVCRPRNNQKGNRISEHGRGHAVDIAAIVLQNGTVISVLEDWGKGRYGRLLKAIRKAACGPFTTVLGPGSDRFHRNHLHFDTAQGRGQYCR